MSATKLATKVWRHAKTQPAIHFLTGADWIRLRKDPSGVTVQLNTYLEREILLVMHTIKDVEDYLGVSKSTVYRLIADGQFDVCAGQEGCG